MSQELGAAITQLYLVFDRYPRPDVTPVCPMCGAGVDQGRLQRSELRDWSDADLAAIHVLSLPDASLRHFLPRVLELVIGDPCTAFEFGLSGLEGRVVEWLPDEHAAIEYVLATAWETLLSTYPATMTYPSSAADLLDVARQLGLSTRFFLDVVDVQRNPAADLHVASLVDFAYTTSDKAASAPIASWLRRPMIGQRLHDAFYEAPDDATANCLAAAYDLWHACTPLE